MINELIELLQSKDLSHLTPNVVSKISNLITILREYDYKKRKSK